MGRLAIIALILTLVASGVVFASGLSDEIDLTVEVSEYAELTIGNKELKLDISMTSPETIPVSVQTSITVGHNYDVSLSFSSRGFRVANIANSDLDDLISYKFVAGGNNVTFAPCGGNKASPLNLKHVDTKGTLEGVFEVGFNKDSYTDNWSQVAAGTYQDVITVTISPDYQ